MKNKETKQTHDFRPLLTSATLVGTYLAQLGGHQEIHYQIAHLAMGIETGTLVALFLSSKLKQTSAEFSRSLNYLATIGLLLIGGCFAAIPATDDRYQAFFQNGRSITNLGDWPDFVSQSLWPDFEHHIELGIQTIQGGFSLPEIGAGYEN